jgi:acetolactate synthase-1/2/3 large subunit
VFGLAYPQARTLGVVSDIDAFLARLLPRLTRTAPASATWRRARPQRRPRPRAATTGVHPAQLMAAIQERVVDGSDALIHADIGSSFSWTNALLRLREPGRYRVAPCFGSMSQATSGVVGSALARRGKAVALVGDGAMLMLNELSTAVAYRVPAVWIVLNDAQYGMIHHGTSALGLAPFGTEIPRVDFVAYARALGADGVAVPSAAALRPALAAALAASRPFVVDVHLDPTAPPPFGRRNEVLLAQASR